ncbi:hypothetical protein HanIR_Chr11g0551851 [Helianthus annuus]|nr:hypothetical protein HanIR_Chr11g0551851 [Helianthus annuus]
MLKEYLARFDVSHSVEFQFVKWQGVARSTMVVRVQGDGINHLYINNVNENIKNNIIS